MEAEKKKRGDPLKSGTEVFEKRQARHRHNGYQGSIGMALSAMVQIEMAETTSQAAKQKAREIWNQLEQLREELKVRIDR